MPRPAPSLSHRSFLAATATAIAATQTAPAQAGTPPAESQTRSADPFLTTTNPGIVKGREAGLGLLQPTRAQLEHGLEVHRQSLVFDSYGFAPRAAMDGAALIAADQAGASDQELADLREEMGMIRPAQSLEERNEFAEALRNSPESPASSRTPAKKGRIPFG